MTLFRILLPCLLVAACAPATREPGPAPAAGPPAPALPEVAVVGDTNVVIGRLENGLTYYVRRNAEPRARAELRLVVNVGSVVEDADQRGLAHFLEHMAFNGTRRFEKHEIVDYLERVGMRFGPDVNAYTSFDETVYMLQLPTDSAGVLETGLRILEDWAAGIGLDSLEVEKERGVVIEEWRRMLGAGSRIAERQFPFLFAGSRYAERLPIGDPETLRTFRHETLRRFYREWYRPELMAVVAVGDFDPRAVEAQIRAGFGALSSPRGRVRQAYPLPPRDTTRFLVTVDPELPATVVSINHMRPERKGRGTAEYRASLVESLLAGMLGDRLNEISLAPDAPFLDVSTYQGASLRGTETFVLDVRVAQGGAERGLAAVLAEVRRAALHGFTAAELERETTELRRIWEQMYAERDRTESAQYAGQYAQHFLSGYPLRTTEDEYRLVTALLPTITLADVDAAARALAAHRDRTVLVSGPSRPGVPAPDPARLAAVADSASRGELAAYAETPSEAPLVARPPVPGRVVAVDSVPEVGVTRWTLANGARVVLRPTDFKQDEILFAAYSPGGLSLVPDSAFLYGRTATAAVQLGGVGELSLTDLQRRLSGKMASVGASISGLSEGMQGAAAPRDVETLFQLAYLYFTAPRRDTASWHAYLQRGRESLRNRDVTPESAFGDTLTALLTQRHPRSRPFTSATFDSLSLDRALEIYRERFGDAADFTFFLVGSFTPDSIRPLVETWLGGLPGSGRRETWRDVGVRPPPGVVRGTVRRGMEAKARTTLVFSGPAEFSREARWDLAALGDALEIRLREKLREDLGATYGVSAYGGVSRDPRPEYQFVVDFGSAPDRVDELVGVVLAEIDTVRAGGVPADVVEKVREAHRRTKEISLRENPWWLTALMDYERYGWDPRTIDDPPLTAALTAEAIRDAARRYLDPGRYVHVTLLPEAAASSPAP
ncbi:MAG TPA: insulinase family protein [Longimicrobium sp.]|nr:insulinase family protein [Longimicrobium sp.]